MNWLWLLALPLVPLVVALVLPVRLRFCSEPLHLEVRWGLLGFRAAQRERGLNTQLGLWAWWFTLKDQPEPKGLEKPSPPPEEKKKRRTKKKKAPKKASKRRPHIGWAEAKMLFKHPVPRLLLRRLKGLGWGLLKAVRIHRARLIFGGMEPFGQGVLAVLCALWPALGRFEWSSNFTGRTQFFVEVRLLTWRLGLALLRFLFSLPYLKAFKLYRQLNQPQPAKPL